MKNKSWIIILIMGIALAISLAYSIWVSQRASDAGESTVTTTSIIEMTATTATIKNTLTGTGTVEYREKEEKLQNQNTENTEVQENNGVENDDTENNVEEEKKYQITLTIEDKDLEKAQTGQEVEISIKREDETLNYLGEVNEIAENTNNHSTLNIEITNPDERIEIGNDDLNKIHKVVVINL